MKGSGSRAGHPGDVISDEWLGECKTHTSPGHTIQFYQSVWNKLSDEAFSQHKFPVLFVDDGSQNLRNTWCLFTAQPTCAHIFTHYEYPVKSAISFKNEKLKKHHDLVSIGKPVIYIVELNEFESLNLATFQDFVELFNF